MIIEVTEEAAACRQWLSLRWTCSVCLRVYDGYWQIVRHLTHTGTEQDDLEGGEEELKQQKPEK